MTYTPELGEAVLEAIETRLYGLRRICAELSAELGINLHARDIMRWKDSSDPQDFVPGFKERYLESKREQVREYMDQTVEIADTPIVETIAIDKRGKAITRDNVSRSKLMVEARQFRGSRLLPEYSEKHQMEHSGEGGGPVRFVLERIGAKKE